MPLVDFGCNSWSATHSQARTQYAQFLVARHCSRACILLSVCEMHCQKRVYIRCGAC